MRAAVRDGRANNFHVLQEELKKLGITVVSGRQDTVISVKVKGLAGRALIRGLRLADQLLQEKIKHALKACTDPATNFFTDPTFGPSSSDPDGAAAMCKAGSTIPSKGGSQHQAKVLGLLQRAKVRWERPIYATDNEEDENNPQGDDEDDIYAMAESDNVFASNATLFADGVSSGDVIQGNLGDCWFLSALSVVATRSDLLEQTFWRKDQFKSTGLFVCKFMKNFVWNYVLIDDRIPVFGFSDKKAGKPYFARCRNPDELWVSLLEKAYAKLHGSYEALIGGFVDCALNDLTGMCSEQVILKDGFPGFGENPYAPIKPQQKHGDPFWDKITRYKQSGTLMGCSIQPPVTSSKDVAVESSAGSGLYFKHAYALVDAADIKTAKGECVRLVKLRNPWGMGEWTGPWSDSSEERSRNEDAIEKFFKIMKRKVGANAEKRVFMTLSAQGKVSADEISQEEVIEINANDGTFFMSFDAWMQSFTHFFAGIDFPDAWHGRRSEGSWNEANCGGNTTKSTWINNPHFELVLEQCARVFISLSQEDPRGSDNLKIVPVGFHICSLSPVGNEANKFEIREPVKKLDAYYRLYKPADRESFQTGKRPEHLPPAIIPGTVIPGIDDDGIPQPAYTFKQAVSTEATMEPGRYCIIPSMYMRTDKVTGNTNVGTFWVSVYSDKPTFRLEGGEKIVEEEEGEEEAQANGDVSRKGIVPLDGRLLIASLGKKSETIVATGNAVAAEKRRRYEHEKEELLRQAKRYGIGLRELRAEFSKVQKIQKVECRIKLQKLGFNVATWDDEKIVLLFGGMDDSPASGVIHTDRVLKLFTSDSQEEKMACELPDMEGDGDTPNSIHREGILEIELHGASGLAVCGKRQSLVQRKVQVMSLEFSAAQSSLRRRIALEILERDASMAWYLRHFARKSALLAKSRYASPAKNRDAAIRPSQLLNVSPVAEFYDLLEKEYAFRLLSRKYTQDGIDDSTPVSRTPIYSKNYEPSPYHRALQPKGGAGLMQNRSSSDAVELHKINRIRNLEIKRSEKLAVLLQQKQQALGDAEKTSALPRLIGGRKSGSSHVKCSDCGTRVLVGGRGCQQTSASGSSNSYLCTGANCVSVLCSSCYSLLPVTSKLCEACFQHEISPEEALGEQLRVVLIEKIGASDQQRTHLEEVFRSFDMDGSGALSAQEFEKMLQLLNIQPALTQGQKTFLIDQFDANADGEISLTEFKNWILRDHLWEESPLLSGNRETKIHTAAEVSDSVITPIRDEILDLAYEAYAFSSTFGSWSHSANSISKGVSNPSQKGETGTILFQRVISLGVASSAAINASEKIFEQVDNDGSGTIDQFEFIDLLSALGIHLHSEDAKLLMSRLKTSPAGDGNSTITRSAFITYVEQTSTKSNIGKTAVCLREVLVRLDEVTKSGANAREILQSEFQKLHENMSEKDMLMICKALDEKTGFAIGVDEVQSLATNLSFHLEAPVSSPESTTDGNNARLVSYKSSGDLLARGLLPDSSDLMKHVKTFDVVTGCVELATHLHTRSGTNSTSTIWRSVFATDTSNVISLGDFLDGVLRTGFSLCRDNDSSKNGTIHTGQLPTQLLLSTLVDAVRYDCQPQQTNTEASVSYNLFKLIMRLQKIKDIELKFQHALASFLQICQGEQQHLVTIGLDYNRNLIIRAQDPILKFSADFILREDEYDYQNLLAQVQSSEFERRLQQAHDVSREITFSKSPHGLITSDFYPDLNRTMLAILGRLRVDFRRRSTTSHSSRSNSLILSIVESDGFVITLRSLLSQVDLPFFWCVSNRCLSLSIDSEFLDQQGKTCFQQLVADTISVRGPQSSAQLRALATFVSHTASSLLVRYQVVGKYTNVETSWQEFQEFVAGNQDAYAVIELRPQGSLFSTRVARATGSGAAQWNFKTHITMEEPKICDHRIDRPVVFTDTVKVASIPGSSSADNTNFVVGDSGENPGHFVVVSVRRALPSGPDSPKPRLYCTAYDPLTSCDYTVEGYPLDWPIDFFDVTTNPLFESQWQAILSTMKLGVTITPKLCVTVFNKQPKTDKLIGVCEVSVGSAITLEGQIFEERIMLQPPTSSLTPSHVAGVTALTFRFDVKRASTIAFNLSTRRDSHQTMGTAVPIKLGAKYLAGEILTPRTEPIQDNNDDKLQQLHASIASIELKKLEALEQVRQLKAQVQQLSYASTKASDDTSERWKRRLEQARQEQFGAEEEHAARLSALQQELRKLTEENVKQMIAPRQASNLQDCRLSAEASAQDILSAMRAILTSRCPERPYNGLKKAFAAEAEVPGKVTFAVLNDVLGDFGLGLSSEHRTTLSNLFDPEMVGRVSIADFFIKLCGDAEAYAMLKPPRSLSPAPVPMSGSRVPSEEEIERIVFTPFPPPMQRPVSPTASPLRTSGKRSKMSWQDMKNFLVLNLPEGWETRFTEKGRPYFCYHANRSTHWKHPRPEIETIFSEWVQENGAYFNRKSTSSLRASRQKQ